MQEVIDKYGLKTGVTYFFRTKNNSRWVLATIGKPGHLVFHNNLLEFRKGYPNIVNKDFYYFISMAHSIEVLWLNECRSQSVAIPFRKIVENNKFYIVKKTDVNTLYRLYWDDNFTSYTLVKNSEEAFRILVHIDKVDENFKWTVSKSLEGRKAIASHSNRLMKASMDDHRFYNTIYNTWEKEDVVLQPEDLAKNNFNLNRNQNETKRTIDQVPNRERERGLSISVRGRRTAVGSRPHGNKESIEPCKTTIVGAKISGKVISY